MGMTRYIVLVRWYGTERDTLDVQEFDNIREAMSFIRRVFDRERGQAILLTREEIPVVINLLRRWA